MQQRINDTQHDHMFNVAFFIVMLRVIFSIIILTVVMLSVVVLLVVETQEGHIF
jgi:hypothetical protein